MSIDTEEAEETFDMLFINWENAKDLVGDEFEVFRKTFIKLQPTHVKVKISSIRNLSIDICIEAVKKIGKCFPYGDDQDGESTVSYEEIIYELSKLKSDEK